MPVVEDRVSGFIKTREGKVFGLKIRDENYLYSFEDKRGEPWEPPETTGSAVRFEWEPYEKDGKTKRYITVIQTLAASQDVTPEAPSGAGEARDGQFRSPLDFRRTSALAQAVAFHAQDATPSVTEVIKTAAVMEKYLEGGYERS